MTALQQILMSAVGGGIQFLSAQAASVPSGGGTINFTQTLLQGDFVLFTLANDNVTSIPTIGSGYTTLNEAIAAQVDHSIRYKIMGVTPDTSITISGGGATTPFAALILYFRRVNQTTPIDVATQVTSPGTVGFPDPPPITTATARAVIVAIGIIDDTNVTAASLTGYNDVTFSAAGGAEGASCSIAAGWLEKTIAGTEDPPVFTMTGTADVWVGATVALRLQ